MPVDDGRRRRRLADGVAGSCIGLALLLVFLRVTMPVPHPLNSGWIEYVRMVDFLWDPENVGYYNIWRKPLFPFLAGLGGNLLGLDHAASALFLTRVSVGVTVLGTAGTAWVLGGRWAAVLAAVSLPWIPNLLYSVHWINAYPLLTACTAATLLLGTLACRRPSVLLGLGTGLAAGTAWAVDHRGLTTALLGALLVAGSLLAERSRRTVLAVGLCVLGILALQGLDRGLSSRYELQPVSFSEQVTEQHKLLVENVTSGRYDGTHVGRECAGITHGLPTTRAMSSPCGRAVAGANYWMLQPHSLPGPGVFLLLPLALLPASWGRRSSLASLLIFGSAIGSFLVGASWVSFFPRYVHQLLPASVLLVPLAVTRLGELLARKRPSLVGRLGPALVLGVGLAVVTWVWPGPRSTMLPHPLVFKDPTTKTRETFESARWLREALKEEHRVVDCSEMGFDALLDVGSRYDHAQPMSRACLSLVEAAGRDGGTWLLMAIPAAGQVPEDPTLSLEPFSAAGLEAAGWVEATEWRTDVAWNREGRVPNLWIGRR